jgi:hypothetical protein
VTNVIHFPPALERTGLARVRTSHSGTANNDAHTSDIYARTDDANASPHRTRESATPRRTATILKFRRE